MRIRLRILNSVLHLLKFKKQYITRFKVRFEREIDDLTHNPLSSSALNELQLTRARRVVNASKVILGMGPHAVHIDHKKFELWRSILLLNNVSYNKTQRDIKNKGHILSDPALQLPSKGIRHR
ncbi:hypothetical protein CRE_30454 [Caenorhabditis remanei]|uniref:Uncharacterized protein n=2 Tax=Caenorhabditis remanei TaxID=31234 RepID=E3NE04_CAERE|nr:hypothetical protein CRE_30454 [Caenorhabditis remanei]